MAPSKRCKRTAGCALEPLPRQVHQDKIDDWTMQLKKCQSVKHLDTFIKNIQDERMYYQDRETDDGYYKELGHIKSLAEDKKDAILEWSNQSDECQSVAELEAFLDKIRKERMTSPESSKNDDGYYAALCQIAAEADTRSFLLLEEGNNFLPKVDAWRRQLKLSRSVTKLDALVQSLRRERMVYEERTLDVYYTELCRISMEAVDKRVRVSSKQRTAPRPKKRVKV